MSKELEMQKNSQRKPIDHGDVFTGETDHRTFVGGMWDTIGKLQFDFMKSRGLLPTDVLVDIACGALRAGTWFIPYLDRGHYLGLEAEPELLEIALNKELSIETRSEKEPEFVISRAFEFQKFTKAPTFGIANSLFTHLNENDILLCLSKLRDRVEPGMQCFITFREPEGGHQNPERSHANVSFRYSPDQMCSFGENNGFSAEFIGDWGHPRNQKMMLFTAS